jgi:hypothetical protein
VEVVVCVEGSDAGRMFKAGSGRDLLAEVPREPNATDTGIDAAELVQEVGVSSRLPSSTKMNSNAASGIAAASCVTTTETSGRLIILKKPRHPAQIA